jgi:hypothetical protein
MHTTALAVLLPISLAAFGLFGKFAFDMRRDHNYAASWGWSILSILPGFLSALYLISNPEISVPLRNFILGSLGAALGACAAIWIGYLISGSVASAQPATTTPTPSVAPSTLPQTPTVNQGPGSAYSVGQQGGVTAGTYLNMAPEPKWHVETVQPTRSNSDGTFTHREEIKIDAMSPPGNMLISVSGESIIDFNVIHEGASMIKTWKDGYTRFWLIQQPFGAYWIEVRTTNVTKPNPSIQFNYSG